MTKSDTLLILNAKHNPNEEDRKLAGEELVRSCARNLDHNTLLAILGDEGFGDSIKRDAERALAGLMSPLGDTGRLEDGLAIISDDRLPHAAREKTGEAFVDACARAREFPPLIQIIKNKGNPYAVIEKSKKVLCELVEHSGSMEAMAQLAFDRDIPGSIRQFFGMKLYEIHSLDDDLAGLMSIASNKDAHDEPRKAASFKLFHYYEKAGSFSSMQAMIENATLPYEVRKGIALRVIDLCIESGNYPLLIVMGQSSGVPMNIRIDVEDKVDIAAGKAIQNAVAIGDTSLLSFMSHDERLSDILRARSKSELERLSQKGSNGHAHSGQELAARLARTLGRASQPPPPRESSPPSQNRKISH
jgi:hypothetical protein